MKLEEEEEEEEEESLFFFFLKEELTKHPSPILCRSIPIDHEWDLLE